MRSHIAGPLCLIANPLSPWDRIAEMSLGDLGTIFDYAVQSTTEGYDEQEFLSGLSPKVKSAVHAVEKAAAESRGENVKVLRIDSSLATKPGNP